MALHEVQQRLPDEIEEVAVVRLGTRAVEQHDIVIAAHAWNALLEMVGVMAVDAVGQDEAAAGAHQFFHVAGEQGRGGDAVVAHRKRRPEQGHAHLQRMIEILADRGAIGLDRLGIMGTVENQIIDVVIAGNAERPADRDGADVRRQGGQAIEDGGTGTRHGRDEIVHLRLGVDLKLEPGHLGDLDLLGHAILRALPEVDIGQHDDTLVGRRRQWRAGRIEGVPPACDIGDHLGHDIVSLLAALLGIELLGRHPGFPERGVDGLAQRLAPADVTAGGRPGLEKHLHRLLRLAQLQGDIDGLDGGLDLDRAGVDGLAIEGQCFLPILPRGQAIGPALPVGRAEWALAVDEGIKAGRTVGIARFQGARQRQQEVRPAARPERNFMGRDRVVDSEMIEQIPAMPGRHAGPVAVGPPVESCRIFEQGQAMQLEMLGGIAGHLGFQAGKQPMLIELGRRLAGLRRIGIGKIDRIEGMREGDRRQPLEALSDHRLQGLLLVGDLTDPARVQEVELLQIEETQPIPVLQPLALRKLIQGRDRPCRLADGLVMLQQGIVGYLNALEIEGAVEIGIEVVGNAPLLAAMQQKMLGGGIGRAEGSKIGITVEIFLPIEQFRQLAMLDFELGNEQADALLAIETAFRRPMTGKMFFGPGLREGLQIGMGADIDLPVEIAGQIEVGIGLLP